MDEEKMQRQMEFIVEQQAQVAVSHAQSAAKIAQLEELLVQFARATRERFEGTDQRAQEETRKAAKRSEELDRKIAALIDAQIRAEDRMAEIDTQAKERAADLDRRAALLFDAQRQTEETVKKVGEDIRRLGERIDGLTTVVERHIVEGHNGRAQSES
jgi:ABC-type transporter Mla subunit MlaD